MNEYTSEELKEAVDVWREAERQEPNRLLWALRVLRSWRVQVKSELRGTPRTSEKYRELKEFEEGLEAKILDLDQAWRTELSDRRYAG